jgi:hypothetical protein
MYGTVPVPVIKICRTRFVLHKCFDFVQYGRGRVPVPISLYAGKSVPNLVTLSLYFKLKSNLVSVVGT